MVVDLQTGADGLYSSLPSAREDGEVERGLGREAREPRETQKAARDRLGTDTPLIVDLFAWRLVLAVFCLLVCYGGCLLYMLQDFKAKETCVL